MNASAKVLSVVLTGAALMALTLTTVRAEHGGHKRGDHKSRHGAHFMMPGVMKTVLDHSSSAQRRDIKKEVRSFRSNKKTMAKLMQAGDADEAKVAEVRGKIKGNRQKLSSIVKEAKEGNSDLDVALRKLREDTWIAAYLMRHHEELDGLSQTMGRDGTNLGKGLKKNHSRLEEYRGDMRDLRAGVDYGEVDKTRRKIRETMEDQQNLVSKAFKDNPEIRTNLLVAMKNKHKERHGHKHHKDKDGGSDCDAHH